VIVLDASVVVELLLRTPDALALEERVFGAGTPLHVPHLVDVEVAQVLRRYALRRDISGARGATALTLLGQFPLARHAHAPLAARVWALRANLTAYDAVYVALAEGLGATLLTRDASLARAPGVQAQVEVV
jgi:predicted nucleic acid-binding protein